MAIAQRGALEWARLIDEWNLSGLSLPEFCRQRGLKKGTMSGWVYKPSLKRVIENARRGEGVAQETATKANKPSAASTKPAFVPVRLRPSVTPSTITDTPRSAIEILVGPGRRVRVERGFDAETLRRVVAALESGSC